MALARAIALDPELIMYDEPFAGLDPISLGITANLIRTLNDALGATSILVSHDVPESFAIADYVYLHARTAALLAQGTPDAAARVDGSGGAPVHRRRARRPVPLPLSGAPLAADFGIGGQGMIGAPSDAGCSTASARAGYATRMFLRLVLEFCPAAAPPASCRDQIHSSAIIRW